MNASVPEEKPQSTGLDPVTQEKIREFCYELALALRRITGRMIAGDGEGLPVDMGEKPSETDDKEAE